MHAAAAALLFLFLWTMLASSQFVPRRTLADPDTREARGPTNARRFLTGGEVQPTNEAPGFDAPG